MIQRARPSNRVIASSDSPNVITSAFGEQRLLLHVACRFKLLGCSFNMHFSPSREEARAARGRIDCKMRHLKRDPSRNGTTGNDRALSAEKAEQPSFHR